MIEGGARSFYGFFARLFEEIFFEPVEVRVEVGLLLPASASFADRILSLFRYLF